MSAEGERRSYFDQKITRFLGQNCDFFQNFFRASHEIGKFCQIGAELEQCLCEKISFPELFTCKKNSDLRFDLIHWGFSFFGER